LNQPSSLYFHLIDKMMILKEGNCIYHGKTGEAMKFFEERGKFMENYFNPFEFILDTTENFEIKADKGKQLNK